MKNKRLLAAGILSILALYGCDDSSGSSPTTGSCTDGSECESGHCNGDECAALAEKGGNCDEAAVYCSSGLRCVNNICVEYVGLGESCNSTDTLCDGTAVCDNNRCKENQSEVVNPPDDEDSDDDEGGTTDECENSDQCGNDKVCEEGACTPIVHLKHGDACSGKESEACEEGTSCFMSACRTDAEIQDYGKCHSKEDCTDEYYPDCLPSGKCGTLREIGDLCDNENPCKDGAECNLICTKTVSLNEPCDEENGIFCANATCVAGFCRSMEYNLPTGSECNEDYLFCANKLTCYENKCVTLVSEDGECNEDENLICKHGLECLETTHLCTPVGSTCEKTSDCLEKDMFCCLDESCGAVGRCIPYDDKITHDDMCMFTTKPGIFEAQVQCRWQPPKDDKYPTSKKVEMPPLVGHFGNSAGIDTVIAVWAFDARYVSSSHTTTEADKKYNASKLVSTIRFINPENCDTLETIRVDLDNSWLNYPAALDVDKDGFLELVVLNKDGKPVMYKWNAEKGAHEVKWTGTVTSGDTPMFFDVDSNGSPELILGTSVINAQTGKAIYTSTSDQSFKTFSLGYLDTSTQTSPAFMFINRTLYQWNLTNKNWDTLLTLDTSRPFTAYADFGTPGSTAEKFNFSKLDGYPELVSAGNGVMSIYAVIKPKTEGDKYTYQIISTVNFTTPVYAEAKVYGGPITIGDFNSDGLPEVGIASSGFFGVYDPKCKSYEAGKCAAKGVLWERWSQDASSGRTGSSLFDFDGDGQAEAVYADECFTRVYDGKTGRVLFSSKRSSSTSIEAPVIADVDGDGSAEILMGSDNNISCFDDDSKDSKGARKKINPNSPGTSNAVDPIHEGIRCTADEDCPMQNNCDTSIGFCLCTVDDDCNTQKIDDPNNPGTKKTLKQYVCAPPIDPNVGFMVDKNNSGTRTIVKDLGARPSGWNKDTGYKVCRATRLTTDIGVGDLMIFKDRLDRWVSSRKLWNQHAYNIINIEDNGSMTTHKNWNSYWKKKSTELITGTSYKRPVYNNFRLNSQGQFGAGMAPDITGRFIAGSVCGQTDDGRHVISGKLCNRGTKPVADKLPATFFYYDENAADHKGQKICTSYTNKPIGIGECDQVGCKIETEAEFKALAGKKVLMISNLNEFDQPSTIECNSDNNSDNITIESCAKEIVIVN